MSVWLFEDMGFQDPKKDVKAYIALLADTIGNLGGDLYFPMQFFVHLELPYKQVYADEIEKVRSIFFEQREAIKGSNSLLELGVKAIQVEKNIRDAYEKMLFILATFPDSAKWIGSCSISRQTSGILNTWFNEVLTLAHLLKYLPEKCGVDKTQLSLEDFKPVA